MVKNFFYLSVVQGINYILPFLSYPYLVYVLGMERWGLVAFGYAMIQYFVMFTDFGFNLSATKFIAQHRGQNDTINSFLNSAFVGRIILACISLIVLLIIVFSFERFHIESTFYLLFFGIVIGNVMYPLWFFQGIEQMKYITIFNLTAKSLSIIPIFLFVKSPEDYIIVPVCYSVGYLLAGLCSIYFIYNRLGMRWFITPIREIMFALKDSSTYFLSRASLSLFTTSNTFVLGLVCGNTITGFYASAEKLYLAYEQLAQPFLNVLFPHMSKTHDVSFFRRVFTRISAANILLITIILSLSYWIVTIVFPTGDVNIITTTFRTLLIATLFSVPSMLLGYPLLAAMEHPNYANLTVILTSAFHVLALIILYLFGDINLMTVSVLVVCSQCLMLILRVGGVRKFKLFTKPVTP